MTHEIRENCALSYRDWVHVLEAIDCAREETLKAAAAAKAGFAARKALSIAADRYTLIGQDLAEQLGPEVELPLGHPFDDKVPSGFGVEDIPDPRDGSDPTAPPSRRGKRKNGPLADL